MKLVLTNVFVFCIIFLSFSQPYYNWDEAKKLDDSVFIKANNFYKSYYKNNVYVGEDNSDEASLNATYFYADYIKGNLYPSFMGYEAYIKNVLKQLISDEKLLSNLKIYFYKEADFNASMDALGNLRLNVGLFCYINTEAELAAVLAHEFAHFYNKDGLEKRNYVSSLFGGIPNLSYKKTQESAADFLAIKYIKDSPYSLKGIASAFKTLKRFEIKAALKGHSTLGQITHPDPGDRLKQVKFFSRDSLQANKKNFVVDSVSFLNLKKAAVHEAQRIMLSDNNFKDLIELSFTTYLYEPDNHQNLSVLLESIKRYSILNPLNDNKQFIISFYKGAGAEESENYKFVSNDSTSILRYLNKGLLHLQSTDLSKLSKSELLDSSKLMFTTNKEAFDYFLQKARQLKCKPCLFTEQYNEKNKLVYNNNVPFDNSIFDCRSYLQDAEKQTNYTGNVCIINTPSLFFWEYMRDYTPQSLNIFLNKIATGLKESSGFDKIYFIGDLSLKDQNNLNNLNKIIERTVTPGFYYFSVFEKASSAPSFLTSGSNLKTEEINWLKTMPENYNFFKDQGAKNIYFVDFDYLTIDPIDYPMMVGAKRISRSWKFKKIGIYAPYKVTYSHNIVRTTKSLEECLKECATNLKWFQASNK